MALLVSVADKNAPALVGAKFFMLKVSVLPAKITMMPSSDLNIDGKLAKNQTAKTAPKLALPPKTKLMVPHSTSETIAATTSTKIGLATKTPSVTYRVHLAVIARCSGGI